MQIEQIRLLMAEEKTLTFYQKYEQSMFNGQLFSYLIFFVCPSVFIRGYFVTYNQ